MTAIHLSTYKWILSDIYCDMLVWLYKLPAEKKTRRWLLISFSTPITVLVKALNQHSKARAHIYTPEEWSSKLHFILFIDTPTKRQVSATAFYKMYYPQVRLESESHLEKKSWRNGLELKRCFAPEETLCILFSGAFASLDLSAASLARPPSALCRTPSHSLPQIPASAPGCN